MARQLRLNQAGAGIGVSHNDTLAGCSEIYQNGILDYVADRDQSGQSDGSENSYFNPAIYLSTGRLWACLNTSNDPPSLLDEEAFVINPDSFSLAGGWL